jgi:phage terminase large subunit-like protein
VFTQARWYGQPFRLLAWQKQLLVELFELDGDRRRYQWAYISVAKKNGKTELMAALALWFLIASGEPSPLVACAAGSDDQADLIFGAAKTMCEESPTLRLICETFDAEIQVPSIPGAKLVRVAASARRFGSNLDGKNLFVVICDELHVWEGERGELVWGTLTRGTLARAEPMVLQVTTAGYDRDSICYRQYEHAQRVLADPDDDPQFYAFIREADDAADHTDPEVWKAVNPSYGEIMTEEAYRTQLTQQHEYEFRRYYLNQWTTNLVAWLPAGAWEACTDRDTTIASGSRVVLAFDGSYNNDSTALVACSIDRTPHVEVVAVWERPTRAAEDWTVPILDVEDTIRAACQRWRVKEIACDPYRWARSFEILEADGLPVVKFPQTPNA